jgi:Lon protease-like protein
MRRAVPFGKSQLPAFDGAWGRGAVCGQCEWPCKPADVTYIGHMELPTEVPVMTLPNAILFPQAYLPLYVFEPRYQRMLKDTLDTHRMFTVAMQRPGQQREKPSAVAGLGLIRASVSRQDGTSNLVLQGIARVELTEVVRYRPYRVQRIRPLASEKTDGLAVEALTMKVLEIVSGRLAANDNLMVLPSGQLQVTAAGADVEDMTNPGVEVMAELKNPGQVADLVSWTLLADPLQRQALLETLDVEFRLRRLIQFLMAETGRTRNN